MKRINCDWEMMTRIAKSYRVSDVTIKKWCIGYGINLGRRLGAWTKAIRNGNLLLDEK